MFVEILMMDLFSKEVRVIVSIISERTCIYKNSNNGNKMTGDTLSNLSETFTDINNLKKLIDSLMSWIWKRDKCIMLFSQISNSWDMTVCLFKIAHKARKVSITCWICNVVRNELWQNIPKQMLNLKSQNKVIYLNSELCTVIHL